jgi:hypothetical protein
MSCIQYPGVLVGAAQLQSQDLKTHGHLRLNPDPKANHHRWLTFCPAA